MLEASQYLFYGAITIKQHGNDTKNRNEDQWIRIEDPDINSGSYSQ
jgi:hypothetical protein